MIGLIIFLIVIFSLGLLAEITHQKEGEAVVTAIKGIDFGISYFKDDIGEGIEINIIFVRILYQWENK